MKENQPVSTATDVSTNKTNRLGTENFFVTRRRTAGTRGCLI